MHSFKKAELVDCGGNLKKRWYIKFYVWDVQKGKLIRKRDYSVNDYMTGAERMAYARRRIASINELLGEGYHIDSSKTAETVVEGNEISSLEGALNKILEVKKSQIRRNSYLSFSSTVNGFLEWAKKNRLHTSNILYFDRLNAITWVDYLSAERGLAGKTINSKVSYIKSLFNELLERGIIQENPFVKIKKRKEVKSMQNLAYTDDEIEKLKNAIRDQDPGLWLFIQFIYYCYLRPNEIRQLKVENINLTTGKIFVPAEISKNGKEGYVDIPVKFKQLLLKSKLLNQKKGFLFTSPLSDSRPVSKNKMSQRHRTVIQDLKFDSTHTLYSWKHTGVVKAYRAGVDIKSIQRQCRHSGIEETDKYLKSLGLYENEAFLMKMPGL